MFKTILEALQWQQQQGHAIHLPTPPACEQLLHAARTEGIAVGTLYVVSRPLEAGNIGNCQLDTGDMWCVYDASQGEKGQREVLRMLLQLIARVQLRLPSPRTIAEDWAQVQSVIEQASILAQRWGQAALFSAADLEALYAQAARLEMLHQAAARLVGHQAPTVARRAYLALQVHWSGFPEAGTDLFGKALLGAGEEAGRDSLVDVDRTSLRARWVATSARAAWEAASYGDLGLHPFPASAHALRAALARTMDARRRTDFFSPQPQIWYRSVSEESDLVESILLLNTWLIDQYPQASVRLRAWVYGDATITVCGAAHLYRLLVRYEDLPGQKPTSAHEAWFLFSGRQKMDQRALEGAWQRFLRSWLTWSELCCEDLATGLRALWATLEQH